MKAGVRTALALLLVLAAGCSDTDRQPWALRDISGLLPPLAFQLHDGSGETRSASDFAGDVVLLYFGYTHCPDICPATLARLSAVVRELGSAGGRVRILFVSVDPARDTPDALRSYGHAFGPQVVALSGSQRQLADLTRRYRVSYGLGKPNADGQYEVSHSSAVFIFDSRGDARLLATDADSDASLAADLSRLLSGRG